jgi:hypothetical protein
MESKKWYQAKVKESSFEIMYAGWSLCSVCHSEFGDSNELVLLVGSRMEEMTNLEACFHQSYFSD